MGRQNATMPVSKRTSVRAFLEHLGLRRRRGYTTEGSSGWKKNTTHNLPSEIFHLQAKFFIHSISDRVLILEHFVERHHRHLCSDHIRNVPEHCFEIKLDSNYGNSDLDDEII